MRKLSLLLVCAGLLPALSVAAPQSAVFSLRSDPSGAEVWVNGKRCATTPCELSLSPGSQRVELRQDGRTPRHLAVWAAPGERIVRDAYKMASAEGARALAPAAAGPRKWALLVGVGDYVDEAIPDLRGCANDVKLMKETLTQRFGFPEWGIHTLTDREATKQHVMSEISDWLVRKSRPGDVALFLFSGHGRWWADGERITDTFAPADATVKGYFNDVRDFEFAAAMARIKAARTVVIMDTHHGTDKATLWKGGYASQAQREGFSDQLQASMGAAHRPYVYLAGCRPGEVAKEERFPYGPAQTDAYFGAFTHSLVAALAQAKAGDASWTYQRVMTQTAASMKQRGFAQHPFVAGDAGAALFAR